MAKMFTPRLFIRIPASIENISTKEEFKVSIGTENNQLVSKVQLLVDGKIQPRLTVSYAYPTDAHPDDQFEKVVSAFHFLRTYFDNLDEAIQTQVQDIDLTARYEKQQLIDG